MTGKYLNFHNGYATWLVLMDSGTNFRKEEYNKSDKRFKRNGGQFKIIDKNILVVSADKFREAYYLVEFDSHYFLVLTNSKKKFIERFNTLIKENERTKAEISTGVIIKGLQTDFLSKQ